MSVDLKKLLTSARAQWRQLAAYARPAYAPRYETVVKRVALMSWIALIGMPTYYLVWTYWYPQPYENLGLRAVGVLLCLPGICAARFGRRRWFAAYQVIGLAYILPFFFTYMYLMNGASGVWTQSLLIAVILLFHFDFGLALLAYVLGTVLAYVLYHQFHSGFTLLELLRLGQWPIYLFAIIGVSLAKVGRHVLEAERLAGMAAAMATVSHELRTPLLSVDANVRGMKRLLQSDQALSTAQRAAIDKAVGRVELEVRHMNNAIDLLLSATGGQRDFQGNQVLSMATMVELLLERYPFANPDQARLVAVTVRADFYFMGQGDLCLMILLNLLRNALSALHRAGKGRIRIIVDGARARPRLLFIDTGSGIDPIHLPHIFRRFYSFPHYSGSGIGLSFCKDVMEAWDARIHCSSRAQGYTIFALEFPRPTPPVTDSA